MMHFNPYIEDSDDWLANQGQLHIVLLFLASLVLFVKTMPEQEGAPGNLFRGPLFAAVMVATCAKIKHRHAIASRRWRDAPRAFDLYTGHDRHDDARADGLRAARRAPEH